MADYAHPEVLVTTEWVANHRSDPTIRLIEVDVDTTAPGAPRTVGTTIEDVLPDRGGPRTSTACSAPAHAGPVAPAPR